MKSLGILEFENDSYVFASRFVVSVEGIEQFGVRDFFKGGFVFNHILLLNGKLLNEYIFDSSVRPVVINPTEIQYID